MLPRMVAGTCRFCPPPPHCALLFCRCTAPDPAHARAYPPQTRTRRLDRPLARLRRTASGANHWWAFATSALLTLSGMIVIPYIAPSRITNEGMARFSFRVFLSGWREQSRCSADRCFNICPIAFPRNRLLLAGATFDCAHAADYPRSGLPCFGNWLLPRCSSFL